MHDTQGNYHRPRHASQIVSESQGSPELNRAEKMEALQRRSFELAITCLAMNETYIRKMTEEYYD